MASCNFSGYPDENNNHFFLFWHARSNLLDNINDIVNLGSTTKLEDKGIFIIHVLCSKLQFTKWIRSYFQFNKNYIFLFVNIIVFLHLCTSNILRFCYAFFPYSSFDVVVVHLFDCLSVCSKLFIFSSSPEPLGNFNQTWHKASLGDGD